MITSTNTIGSLFGRKGCGKSTLALEIMREHPRVLVIDYLGEYGTGKGFTVHEGFVSSVNALSRWAGRKRFALSLRVDEVHEALALLEVAWEMRGYLLVIEEASWLCSPSQLPRELSKFVRMGRHREISQLYVAQRPAMVHRDVTSQSDFIVSFQQHEARDIKFLEASTLGAQAEHVRTLPRFAIVAAAANGEESTFPKAVRRRLAKSPKQKAVDTDA